MLMTLRVPDLLGGDAQSVEGFYSILDSAPLADQYVLDLGSVSFLKPYGVVALVMAVRQLAALSGRIVHLTNLPDQVHLYLHRMGLFEVCSDWLRPLDMLDGEWARSPYTQSLLEITMITGPEDVGIVVSRAERIFSHWLMVSDLHGLLSVISELCANVYEHSGDVHGCVLIQKYEAIKLKQAIVNLAVGDLGRGVRGSLVARYGEIGQEPLDYLREAMIGRTARASGHGGLGLRRVEQIAASAGGYAWLRSETAAILTQGPGTAQGYSNLASVPGTQVTVELRAPLFHI